MGQLDRKIKHHGKPFSILFPHTKKTTPISYNLYIFDVETASFKNTSSFLYTAVTLDSQEKKVLLYLGGGGNRNKKIKQIGNDLSEK